MEDEQSWQRAAPRAIAALLRRWDDFAAVEDAVQDGLEEAVRRWPSGGPDDPAAWLVTVAGRRLIDRQRSQDARRRRELKQGLEPDAAPVSDRDDSLALLALCCHPALSTGSQVALTLRAVFGVSTASIAALLLSTESTVAQRISRAKASIRAAGGSFTLTSADDLAARLPAICRTLYLVFTEGHTSTHGGLLDRTLCAEAIRLTQQLHDRLPNEDEITGLLALMLLLDARRDARLDPDGALVPLAEQDRTLWHRPQLDTGRALVEQVLPRGRVGSYQLQAAIAAVHADAERAEQTDWAQIVRLYDLLVQVDPGPVAELNRIVALAMADGPASALRRLDDLQLPTTHRVLAVRARLLHELGRHDQAEALFVQAGELTHNLAERDHLVGLAERCRQCARDDVENSWATSTS